MADIKIDEFSSASLPLGDSDVVHGKQGASDKKITVSQLKGEVSSVTNEYVAGGTANAITLTAVGKTVAPNDYFEGFTFKFKVVSNNTAGVTIDLAGKGIRNTIYKGSALPANILKAGSWAVFRYTTTGPYLELLLSDTISDSYAKKDVAETFQQNVYILGKVGAGNSNPAALHPDADDLVIGDGVGNRGTTIFAGATGISTLYLADGTTGTDRYDGFLYYNHNNRELVLGAGAVSGYFLNSSSQTSIASTATYRANVRLTVVNRSTFADIASFLSDHSTGGSISFYDTANSTYRGYIGYGPQLVTGATISEFAVSSTGSNLILATSGGTRRVTLGNDAVGFFRNLDATGLNSYHNMFVGAYATLMFSTSAHTSPTLFFISNGSYNGTNWISKYNSASTQIYMGTDFFQVRSAPAVAAGAAQTYTTQAQMDINGNWGFNTSPSSAHKLLVIAGATQRALTLVGASGSYTQVMEASTVTSNSFGVYIKAGTDTGDVAFRLLNAAGTVDYLQVRGDGKVVVGEVLDPNYRLTVDLTTNGATVFRSSSATGCFIAWRDSTNSLTRGYIGYGSSLITEAALTDLIVRSEAELVLASGGGARRATILSTGEFCIGNTSGASLSAAANDLVVGSGTGNNGATIYSGASALGNLYFANGTSGESVYDCFIQADHANDSMSLGANGVTVALFKGVASAVNYLQISNNSAGFRPKIETVGSDANIGLTLQAKGIGGVSIYSNTVYMVNNTYTVDSFIFVANISSSVNYSRMECYTSQDTINITAVGAGTALGNLMLQAESDVILTPGTGNYVKFGNYTAGATSVIGYISIKDYTGTIRKLAVIS